MRQQSLPWLPVPATKCSGSSWRASACRGTHMVQVVSQVLPPAPSLGDADDFGLPPPSAQPQPQPPPINATAVPQQLSLELLATTGEVPHKRAVFQLQCGAAISEVVAIQLKDLMATGRRLKMLLAEQCGAYMPALKRISETDLDRMIELAKQVPHVLEITTGLHGSILVFHDQQYDLTQRRVVSSAESRLLLRQGERYIWHDGAGVPLSLDAAVRVSFAEYLRFILSDH
jgi:hypothetical protein